MNDKALREQSQDQLLDYARRMRKRAEKAEAALRVVRKERRDSPCCSDEHPDYPETWCAGCIAANALAGALSPEGQR